MIETPDDDIATLRRILRANHRIAVVGLSAEWHRPSFFAAKYMQGCARVTIWSPVALSMAGP